MIIYMNGTYIDEKEARISALDHGYLYGLGCFETFRTYNGKAFLLEEHLERLKEGLAEFGVNTSVDIQQVKTMTTELLRRNELDDGYFRLNISAGVREVGLSATDYEEPTIIMYVKSLPPQKKQSKKLHVLKTIRNSPEGMIRRKSHHYLNNIIAKREIGNNPHIEGLFLTKDGFISEGIVSNIFFKKNHVVYTPSLATHILPGITRSFVMSLCEELGVKVECGEYSLQQLLDAEEIWLTNSIQEIVSVHEVEGQLFPGLEGEFVKVLQEQYKKWSES